MKAVLQNYGSGELCVTEVPVPATQPQRIIVQNQASLVSAGTEKLMVELAQKSLVGKAVERPDLVRQVIDKVQRDGLGPTWQAVRSRLDTPVPLGYSCAGTVLAVGAGVQGFRPGERVACAGAGYASHAEVIVVPENLAVPVPEGVSSEAAAFVTLGAIALQGIRLAEPQLGEVLAVIGLGLLGQLTVQLLKASGCVVLGLDPQLGRATLALQLGADGVFTDASALASAVEHYTGGHGVDAVLITAGTKSNQPVELAGALARSQGRVIVVGAVGMEMPRKPYYDKELIVRVSRSYGPGRYDPVYEEQGHDYPFGYVRWTENRNLRAFISQLAQGNVDVRPLITHRFAIAEAARAYDLITGQVAESYLGIVLTYPEQQALAARLDLRPVAQPTRREAAVQVGLIGAGAFAVGTLIPALKQADGAALKTVCTATGVSARHVAEKFGFCAATTTEQDVLDDDAINTVFIATRHHLHAPQIIQALRARKHVFCEKPLCLTRAELSEITRVYHDLAGQDNGTAALPLLMVGFNRRFAPLAVKLKRFVDGLGEPCVINYRVNAGYIPPEHWVHDLAQGGGRILGEVCHFVDFLTFLAGAPPVQVYTLPLPNNGQYRDDNLVVALALADGSTGTITYVANADKAFPKERVEVFGGGAVAVLDNFRRLEMVRGGRRKVARGGQDKGHAGECRAFVAAIKAGGPPPIPFAELVAVTEATFGVVDSLQTGAPVCVAG